MGWSSFITALRKYYRENSQLPGLIKGESGISIEDCFVNLALVTQIKLAAQESNLFTEQHHDKQSASSNREKLYQDLLNNGPSINLSDIFVRRDEHDHVIARPLDNRSQEAGAVWIFGRAGTGKTTLLKNICHEWTVSGGRWDNRFDFVFFVKLNLVCQENFWGETVSGTEDIDYLAHLIHFGLGSPGKPLTLNNIRICLAERREQVLLLLDGFDEVQPLYGETTNPGIKLTSLLNLTLKFPNVVLTSRPINSINLQQIPAEFTKRFEEKQRFENLGLTQDNVRQYVRKYFKQQDKPQLAESLIANLDTNPNMMGLAQIPVNITAICLVWQDNQNTAQTMTILYQQVILALSRRYYANKENVPLKLLDEKTVVTACQPEINMLASLAYHAFEGGETQTLSPGLLQDHITFPELENIRDIFGVLRETMKSVGESARHYQPHYFIHLTYQEYFTALYMAKTLSIPENKSNRKEEIARRTNIKKVVDLIVRNKEELRYAIIWQFLAGLLQLI